MKIFKKKDKRTELEKEIDKNLVELVNQAKTSEELVGVVELLEKRQMLNKKKISVSPDTMAIILGNLLGIILILKYEELNCISSKALGFVIRGRV